MSDYTNKLEALAKETKQTRIIRYFADVDLRGQHDGLTKFAKKQGKIDLTNLAAGEFVVFCNVRRNRLKIMTAGNILTYFKAPDESVIDLNVIRLIPRFFNGKVFEYDKALQEILNHEQRHDVG